MPIYGYRCDECGDELEVFQSMSDAPLKTCPVCGGKLRKLLYPVGVQFKGSGFYTTDYKNGRSRSESKSSDASSSSGEKSEKKSSGDTGSQSTEKSGGKKTDAAPSKEGS